MPHFQYTEEGEKQRVDFAYDPDSGRFTIGEQTYLCDGHTVLVDGRRVKFWVHRSPDSAVVWLNGKVYTFDVDDPRRRTSGGADAGAAGGTVKAQMPGKILQVAVKPGDVVTVGTNLLIMESMKMELALDASVAGTVKAVKAEAGQMVSQGQVLVEIEADE